MTAFLVLVALLACTDDPAVVPPDGVIGRCQDGTEMPVVPGEPIRRYRDVPDHGCGTTFEILDRRGVVVRSVHPLD